MKEQLDKDRLPPQPGVFSWKRTGRFLSVLAAFPLFFLIVGLPYLRLQTDSPSNGKRSSYYGGINGARRLYYKDSEPKPPLIILMPVWKKPGFFNRGVRYEVRAEH
jgi:hypothetical protein